MKMVNQQKSNENSIDYRSEIIRKSIHFCSISIPVIYYFISRESALKILIPLTIFTLIVDIARQFVPSLNIFVRKFFGFMMRKHELEENKIVLNGATWVLISATLMITIFPKIIVIPSFSILIISDLTAALIGRKYGKHKFLSKSLEGTLAFFVTAVIVILATPKVEYLVLEYIIGIIAAFVGAIAENLSKGWADDNIVVPFSIGLTIFLLYSILTDFNLHLFLM